MSGKNKINGFMKHKRLIIIGLIAVGFILLIFLTYILTYANNKPKPFKEDKHVKFTNKCNYFTFTVEADSIKLQDKNTGKGQIEITGKISSVQNGNSISNVTVTYELHTNWTTKTEVTGKSAKFNDGNKLTPGVQNGYTASTTFDLGINYPVKVLPLVKVKSPTIYAKVTFTRKNVNDESIQETIYYKFTYSQYYVDGHTTIL